MRGKNPNGEAVFQRLVAYKSGQNLAWWRVAINIGVSPNTAARWVDRRTTGDHTSEVQTWLDRQKGTSKPCVPD